MSLLEHYQKIRSDSMEMVRPLKVEDYVPQPSFFASPPKWNLAHTSWFFEELLLGKYKRSYKIFHPKYSYLFNRICYINYINVTLTQIISIYKVLFVSVKFNK